MMRLKHAFASVATLFALLVVAVPASAQKPAAKKRTDTHAAQSRGAGADQNVKNDSVTNSATAKLAAPPAKGGARTRGAAARIEQLHVDNRTAWYIRIYVDGDYVGLVSPYGDAYGYYSCGVHSLYARAVFDDGSVRTWGPVDADLCGGFTWRLWAQ